jgi:anti-sigma factor ChrR (cupin superfamily)
MKKLINLFEDSNWEKATGYPEGTLWKVLRDDESRKTILLKLPAGFKMGSHSHITTEQHFVLEGAYSSDGEVYHKGSYQIFAAGDEHGPFISEDGALILVVWDAFK